ncbi:hypothetical protein SUGI_0979090 [Cryptomeria japonica]|nr:hypothetical protein SUGI_0979090 [Cryptomeria japonica]
MNGAYALDWLAQSARHSMSAQRPIGFNSFPCRNTPTSAKTKNNLTARRWNTVTSQGSVGYKLLPNRKPTSPKSMNNFTSGRWSYTRMKLTPLAIAEPLTSSSPETNAITENEEENKFNWFQQWYPAAPEYDLDKRVPHAFRVLGLDIVLWWDKREQEWRVFDDSCPHRRAPLSEGRIDEDGDLQCSYHGWCFGSKGECKYIPQVPSDGPPVHTFKKACARVYPCLQQQGIIWFWPNTDPQFKDIAVEKRPPFIPGLSDPSFPCTLSMRDIPYGYEILTENLMDPSHVPYAHHGLVAQTDTARVSGSPKSDRRAGKPINLRLKNLEKSGFQGENEQGSSNFVAPCVYVSDFSFTPKKGMGQTSISGAKEEKKNTILLVFICVPVSPGKSRLIWAFPRNFALWSNIFLPRWITHIQQNLFLDSDLYFLHLEEHKLQDYGQTNWEKACYVPTKADAFVVAFRKWLKQYAGNGVPWGEKYLYGTLPPTPPKEQLMDRYWTHVVKCRSCSGALKVFRVLESITPVSNETIGGNYNGN